MVSSVNNKQPTTNNNDFARRVVSPLPLPYRRSSLIRVDDEVVLTPKSLLSRQVLLTL